MDMSVTAAKAHLTELVRRAEAGEEVVLTRHGHPAVRIVPIEPRRKTPEEIGAAIKAMQDEVRAKGLSWPNQTSNHDWLYDEMGLPV